MFRTVVISTLLFASSIAGLAGDHSSAEAVTTRHRFEDGTEIASTQVIVHHPGRIEANYDRTNRGLNELRSEEFYPADLLDPKRLSGLRVLDVGTGGGKFVLDLRKAGVREAYGLDIKLPEKAKRYHFLYERDARKTDLPTGTFDVIYSNISLFFYEGKNKELMLDSLREMSRLLKKGGRLRLSPVFLPELEPTIDEVPSLKLVRKGVARRFASEWYVELEKN